jgi:hypothetical protein
MAIVPDLNRSPPGRPGNQLGVDPHNLTKAEFATQNDGFRKDVSLIVPVGGSLVLPADGTRNISTRLIGSFNGLGAISLFAGTTQSIKGVLARVAWYCVSDEVQALTILVG